MVTVGGGVVDGLLFDSFEIDPRVRFCVRFGTSTEAILFATFFSASFSSFGVCGRVLDACGVDTLAENGDVMLIQPKLRTNVCQSC